jgi:toxin ParE1/3/4
MSFRLRPAAEADIAAIARHIAKDNPAASRRWVERLEKRCRLLGETPGMGVAKPEVRLNLRMSVMGDYLILYQAKAKGVEIVRVIHGARQWQSLL